MAKFTFGAGNARALLRAPLYLAGSIASRVVRRDDRLWVFGSGIGLGEGALELYRRAAETRHDLRLVWLCSTRTELSEALSLGMRAVSKDSWRGFRLTLRARVVVITHGFGDVNRYGVPGAFVVQLWHGIPLKKLHLDTPAALRLRPLPDHPLVRRMLSVLYRRAARQISLFTAASELSAARLASAFALPPGVLAVTGDPRDDVLLRPHSRGTARTLLEHAVGPLPSKVVLYAPTWRDGAADPGLPTPEEWLAIAAWLARADAALLVRPHPLGVGDYLASDPHSDRVRMLDPTVLREVMPALPAVDALVTDYSSIAYDYSLLERPIVFFAPDLARYESGRGLYEPYRAFTGGTQVTRWADALDLLDGALVDDESMGEEPVGSDSSGASGGGRLRAHAAKLRAEHFDFVDAGATDRVLAVISARLGGEERTASVDPLARPVIDVVRVDGADTADPVLIVGGPFGAAADAGFRSARLVGARLKLEGTVGSDAGRWTVTIPLTAARWGGPRLAPPSGHYRLQLGDEAPIRDGVTDGATETTARVTVTALLPSTTLTPLFRLELSAAGTLDVSFAPPLSDHETGPRAQRALERDYRRRPATPENAVFFESFYSQVAACNPRAIDARLAAERPDVTRYWSTVDASVAIPAGATRVIEGSSEWWRVRSAARLLVVNDWLRKRYVRRPHQRVLQTWHGTMLKRLALDRAGVGLRTRLAVLRESGRWDFLLAQNEHSARIFRSAYRFRGPIWLDGYPRDDALVAGAGAAEVRARLGIGPDQRVVLYAPTWRDDRAEIVDYLNLDSFAAQLDADASASAHAGGGAGARAAEQAAKLKTVILVRGHSRTLRHGRDLEGARVLDVTTYPDITDLLLVADILITDYSSLMFDFTATGKPIIFFTPDIRHYSEDLRGFYFDLLAEAPGAVVKTQAELVAAVSTAHADVADHAARYSAWRERFNPLDDGRAAERVVRRILDSGLLD